MLLEDRLGLTSYTSDTYMLKWTLANDAGVVFVAVFQAFLASKVAMFDDLLRRVKKKFMTAYQTQLDTNTYVQCMGCYPVGGLGVVCALQCL